MATERDKDPMFSIEQSLIGGLLVDGDAILEISTDLYPSHFANEKLGSIYDAMKAVAHEGIAISPTSIGKRLRDRGEAKASAMEQYLHELWGSSASAADARWCAEEIRKAWRLRETGKACSEAVIALRADGVVHEEIVDKLQDRLDLIIKGSQSRGPRPMGQDIERCYLDSRTVADTGGTTGISTGYSRLDWWTAGLQGQSLIVLAAMTAMGKTSLAMNIAGNVARADAGIVVIFSMEMGRRELAGRLIAAETGLDLRRMTAGELGDKEWGRYDEAKSTLTPIADRIMLDVSGQVTPTTIRAHLRRLQRRHEISLVIVDYLQLCGTAERAESQYVRISTISGALKAIAVDFDVPVLALSQLSREAARRNGEPRLSDLRDSGTIEQDANVVVFIHQDIAGRGNAGATDTAEIIVAKNRNGPTGKFKMHWNPASVRFSDITDRQPPVNEVWPCKQRLNSN